MIPLATRWRRIRCWWYGHLLNHRVTTGRYRDAISNGPIIVCGYYRCDCGARIGKDFEHSEYRPGLYDPRRPGMERK